MNEKRTHTHKSELCCYCCCCCCLSARKKQEQTASQAADEPAAEPGIEKGGRAVRNDSTQAPGFFA